MSNQNLWTIGEIAKAVGGTLVNIDENAIVSGISIDSRSIETNDLFIALSDVRDGHEFVNGAIKQGAAAGLVSSLSKIGTKEPAILVPDTMFAMEKLGQAARKRALIAKRIAITGSVGKTTVKELTASALSASGKTHKSIKSYNNHWGVPLTLTRMPQDARFGVFEIGMNHAGEISRLSPQVRPHIAAITTVAPVHIEHFGSESGIADAKAEIFNGVEKNGFILIPKDNKHYQRLYDRASDIDGVNIISFGVKEKADASILNIEIRGQERIIKADIMGEITEWVIREPGEHWLNNSLCALTITALAGGEALAAASVISNFGAIEGRGSSKIVNLFNGGSFTLVDEAYNANPTSVAGALLAMPLRDGKRKIAVLGDMLELGDNENAYHAGLIEAIIESKIDIVFLSGTRMKHLWDILPIELKGGYAETSKELAPIVVENIRSEDVVMIKGSNGSHMNTIVAALAGLQHSH